MKKSYLIRTGLNNLRQAGYWVQSISVLDNKVTESAVRFTLTEPKSREDCEKLFTGSTAVIL